MPQTVRLTDRALLAVSGPEAGTFLQGLITNDIATVRPGKPIYAAVLTPQGKVLFDFLVFEREGIFLLDVSRTRREALQRRLTMYRLRAKVEIAPRDNLAIAASWGDDVTGCDPRNPELGARVIASAEIDSGSGDYLGHRLSLGIPESVDFGQDRMFALDADLDELHGISFTKGCYVGQELTARMKHRATARKRLLPVEAMDGTRLLTDSGVMAAERELGTISSVYGSRGFALIRLDRLDEAGDAAVHVQGTPLRILKPAWLFPAIAA